MTMKDSELPIRGSMIGRRDFFKVGAGAAATIGMLNVVTASAQDRPSSQGVPWWAARPGTAHRQSLSARLRPRQEASVDGRPWRPNALPDSLRPNAVAKDFTERGS